MNTLRMSIANTLNRLALACNYGAYRALNPVKPVTVTIPVSFEGESPIERLRDMFQTWRKPETPQIIPVKVIPVDMGYLAWKKQQRIANCIQYGLLAVLAVLAIISLIIL